MQNQFFYSSLSNTLSVDSTAIYFSNICNCQTIDNSYTLDVVCGVAPFTCVSTTYCWGLNKLECFGGASISIICNGTVIRSCALQFIFAGSCVGTFQEFTHSGIDSVCVCTTATDANLMGAGSGICLCALQQCVGCYRIGTPSFANSNAGLA